MCEDAEEVELRGDDGKGSDAAGGLREEDIAGVVMVDRGLWVVAMVLVGVGNCWRWRSSAHRAEGDVSGCVTCCVAPAATAATRVAEGHAGGGHSWSGHENPLRCSKHGDTHSYLATPLRPFQTARLFI